MKGTESGQCIGRTSTHVSFLVVTSVLIIACPQGEAEVLVLAWLGPFRSL